MRYSYPPLTEDIFDLDKSAKAVVSFLEREAFCPFGSDADMERFVARASLIVKVLPDEILEALLRFRRHGNRDGVLLISGLPIDDDKIGPTPNSSLFSDRTKQYYETELYLVGCASILGEIFAFSSQYGGEVIQNLLPIREHATEQKGTGSAVFLDWHTEDAAFEFRSDMIGLLCLRSHAEAATTVASIRNMHLPEQHKKKLFEPGFRVQIDAVHSQTTNVADRIVPILSGSYADPWIRLDPLYMTAIGDHATQEALDFIVREIPHAAKQIILQPGDIVFIDNQRAVHGRTEFAPKYDGSDRWLQRVSITFDIRKSQHLRQRHFRIIEPSQE